jgi:hypothetical protein
MIVEKRQNKAAYTSMNTQAEVKRVMILKEIGAKEKRKMIRQHG